MTKVLVAYATKHHATEEIAQVIGEILGAFEDLQVEVCEAGIAKDPAAYDAVVLGSAVYMGNWQGPAVEYITRHQQSLAQRPVWLFSSGPTGEGNPNELMKGWNFPEALRPVVEQINPRDVVLFHGKLDTSSLNLLERSAIKMVKAPVGDFRDWNAIRSWARKIAQTLTASKLEAVRPLRD